MESRPATELAGRFFLREGGVFDRELRLPRRERTEKLAKWVSELNIGGARTGSVSELS
jgi:hypothetical protein